MTSKNLLQSLICFHHLCLLHARRCFICLTSPSRLHRSASRQRRLLFPQQQTVMSMAVAPSRSSKTSTATGHWRLSWPSWSADAVQRHLKLKRGTLSPHINPPLNHVYLCNAEQTLFVTCTRNAAAANVVFIPQPTPQKVSRLITHLVTLVGCVAQWLEHRSLTGKLSLTSNRSVADV